MQATSAVQSFAALLGCGVLAATAAGAANAPATHVDAEALAAAQVALEDMQRHGIEIYNPDLTLVRKEGCWELRFLAQPKVEADKIRVPMPGSGSNITYKICDGVIVSRTQAR